MFLYLHLFLKLHQPKIGYSITSDPMETEDLVRQLDSYKKLEGHTGCVNTLNFNADGDILASGSDDRQVILWDWETGHVKLSFPSGHGNNVFQVKFMPHTNDRNIVTCAADGQVRHAWILEGGPVETTLLAKHQGRAHKLVIEPGSPNIFYTCGEDGLVMHFDLRTGAATELECHQMNHTSTTKPMDNRLYAITIDPNNPSIIAVGGSNKYARLYDIRKYKWDGSSDEIGQPMDCFCPPHLRGNAEVGITGLSFSDKSELLVSYLDEFIYLFAPDMGLGPTPTHIPADENEALRVYKGHKNCETVKGVGFVGPKCEYVGSGSDCGNMFIWNKSGGELVRSMKADEHVVNCIECHPRAMALASCGIENDIKIWTPSER